MTDPIADLLTRIRNAKAVGKTEVVLPYSKIKEEIGKILESEKYVLKSEKIAASTAEGGSKFDSLKIDLKYLDDKNKEPAIKSLKRISKPGQRIYVASEKLPVVLGGQGIAIISTSRGLMTNIEARKKKLGGEVICEIY